MSFSTSTMQFSNSLIGASISNHAKKFESSFGKLFPSSYEETGLQKSRALFGNSVINISDEELSSYLTMFEYLIDSWLDEYEKELFNGLTLQRLLQER